jgi:hypothetical protein
MADPQRPGSGPVPAGPSGYVIRPPQPNLAPAAPGAQTAVPGAQTAAPPGASPPAATPAAPAPGVLVREPALVGGLTQNGAVIGGAIMLGLAIVFFVMRNAVRNHLIANRASLSQANGASWALFMFLLVAAFTVVFGLLGGFWTVLSFIAPLGALSLITLVLFVILFNSATRISR